MLPTHRQSHGRSRRRRSHLAIKPTQTVSCPNCGSNKMPHRACRVCGYFRPGLKLATPEQD